MIISRDHTGQVIHVRTGRQRSIRAMLAIALTQRLHPDSPTVWRFGYTTGVLDLPLLARLKAMAGEHGVHLDDDGTGWWGRSGVITVTGSWDRVLRYAAHWSNETGEA